MLSALRLRKLKLSFQRRLYGDKVTEFHIVGNGCLDDSVNENEIPLAIIENGVYKSNSKNAPRRLAYSTIYWAPPVPIILALSFLIVLAVFFGAD